MIEALNSVYGPPTFIDAIMSTLIIIFVGWLIMKALEKIIEKKENEPSLFRPPSITKTRDKAHNPQKDLNTKHSDKKEPE